MHVPELIQHIEVSDRVLEVGPGGTPHPRSDVLLERTFSEEEACEQRGRTEALVTDKEVVYYDCDHFPFADLEFDYVICSHVLEHVEKVDDFASEVSRVAKKGYIEYPTIYYDYVYNFPQHVTFLLYRNGITFWMPKIETPLQHFRPVQHLFLRSLNENKYVDFIHKFMMYFFQGFEWFTSLETERVYDLRNVCFNDNDLGEELFCFE